MSKLLHVTVQNAVAKYQQRDGDIVCCNKYRIRFTFDSEWDGYENKTARFIWGGAYEEVDFTGDTCEVPVIHDAGQVEVGVYAGDLETDPHTSTSAVIPCRGSIKSIDVPRRGQFGIVRGTTPTLTFPVPFDPSTADSIWITFAQDGREVFTVEKDGCDDLAPKLITATLTQQQTLSLQAGKQVLIQIRVGFTVDGENRALASDILTDMVTDVLKDGEI